MIANMFNVPPKFNQICRLCLTLVEPAMTKGNGSDSDEIIKKLSIHNYNHGQHNSHMHKMSNDNVNLRDDDHLNKKNKRSNEISISLSGGSVINNGFVDDDDTDGNISERIYQCLSIKVSLIHNLYKKTQFSGSNIKVADYFNEHFRVIIL